MTGGTVLRGNDGSLYFVRDELLAQCRVEGEYVDRLNKILDQSTGEVEGFVFDVQPSGELEGSIAYVQGDALSRSEPQMPAAKMMSTLMCPW